MKRKEGQVEVKREPKSSSGSDNSSSEGEEESSTKEKKVKKEKGKKKKVKEEKDSSKEEEATKSVKVERVDVSDEAVEDGGVQEAMEVETSQKEVVADGNQVDEVVEAAGGV